MQRTQYYPFGLTFADAVGASIQPYKNGGKQKKLLVPTLVLVKISKKTSNDQLKTSNIDAHQLKKDFLGNKAEISQYDLYKDNKSGEILGKGKPINTREIIQ